MNAETTVKTVSDITEDHRGWLIKVIEPPSDHPLGGPSHRSFVLGNGFGEGVRHWTRPDGTEWVGLTDDDRRGPFVGTERIWPADTPCELVRLVTRRRRRRTPSSAS